jgi:hypothetical protein
MATQRQPGQDQPGRPALGPLGQPLHVPGAELQAHRAVQQLGCLLVGELQVGGAELGQLPPSPQPGQRQRRVAAAGHHQPQLGRQVAHQQPDRLLDRPGLDQVVVVQHQGDPALPRGELVDDHGHHRLRRRRGTLERGGDPLADAGPHPVQRSGHIAPEPGRVVVAFVQRQPGDRLPAAVGPVGQQGRLAEPGRGAHQGQLPLRPLVQPLQQPRADQEPAAGAGPVQLGGQQRIPLGHAGRGPAGRARLSHRRLTRSARRILGSLVDSQV